VKTRAHVIVSGYVQGVFFRETTKRQADSLNVKGWVRNRDDGKVEVVFEGEEQDVQEMVEFCRRGPPHATVTNVDVKTEPFVGKFDSFEISF
jgi:acylphosphatase